MQKVRVLVGVRTRPLMRVIDYLFGDEPEVRIVARSNNGGRLVQYAACLRPEVIVAHARLLGKNSNKAVAEIKRSSPASKVILICSFHNTPYELRRSGADACLQEEALVQQLPALVRKLLPGAIGHFRAPLERKGTRSSDGSRKSTNRKED